MREREREREMHICMREREIFKERMTSEIEKEHRTLFYREHVLLRSRERMTSEIEKERARKREIDCVCKCVYERERYI